MSFQVKGQRLKAKGQKTILLAIAACLFSTSAFAAVYGFENGIEGLTIPAVNGMTFVAAHGHNWVFGDWRTGKYNGRFPIKPYFSAGNFFAWMGPDEDNGRISFTNPVSWFSLRYAAADEVTLQAFSRWNILLTSDTGPANLDTGVMGTLTVNASNISYVIFGVGGMGNYWIIDDVNTGCSTNAECDDGVYCNGQETCSVGECIAGTPVNCAADGLYCNGEEYCDDGTHSCKHMNVPVCNNDFVYCNGEEFCDESINDCGHRNAPVCAADGLYCNGEEFCNELLKTCGSRNAPVCTDDGLYCNGEEFCDESINDCGHRNAPVCAADGLYCNGEEFCDETLKACGSRNAPACADDGSFCNGEEYCDEESKQCGNTGDPCNEREECDESRKACIVPNDDDTTFHGFEDDDTTPAKSGEESWPKGKITGGCCG